MIRIGCCIEIPQMAAACRLGYDFVDFSGRELTRLSENAVKEIKDALDAAGSACLGIHASLPPHIDLIGDASDQEELRKFMQALAVRAGILRVRYIGVGSPDSRRLPENMPKERADARIKENLELMCDMAPGTEILLEGLNRDETNYINTLTEAWDIVRDVRRKNVGLVWDIYHFLRNGERADELPPELFGAVKYLHIADPDGRRYPSAHSSGRLFDTLRQALRRTGVQELAVEAAGTSFETEAAAARAVLQIFKND